LEEGFQDQKLQASNQIHLVLNNILDGPSQPDLLVHILPEEPNMVTKLLDTEQVGEQILQEELGNMLPRKVFQRKLSDSELELVFLEELHSVLLELWQLTVCTIVTMLSDK